MNKLTREQQQSILDFYFRCGDQEEIEQGRDLIASNPEASKLYADLESSLTDLDHIKYDPCPDNLVDLTVARLKLVASSTQTSNHRLHELLEKEQDTTEGYSPQIAYSSEDSKQSTVRNIQFSRPMFELLAAAASIFLVAGILFPGVGMFRAHSRQVACSRNLAKIGSAFASFAKDNNDRFNEATVKAGSPWWKIGDQGKETQSNTRYPFMLIKLGYVEGDVFICKGNKQAHPFTHPSSGPIQFNDFPSRNNISYSFVLFCNTQETPFEKRRKIVASDLNPVFVRVFDKIPCDPGFYAKMNEFEKILLNEELKQLMSINHRGRGQNVLYCDGSVEYVKERIINGDDIFTVDGVNTYTGLEIPAGENDIFLAP